MGLFDEIKGVAVGVGNKAKDVSDNVRLSTILTDEELGLKNIYSAIGKKYVELHANDYEPEFSEIVDKAKKKMETIEGLKEQIRRLKGIKLCPNCGTEVPNNSLFCATCGFKLPEMAAPSGKICPTCGAPVKDGMKFCVSCGTKLEMETAGNPVEITNN